MKPNETSQVKLTTLNDKISSEAQGQPQVTKITRKIVTTTQPVTQTYVSKKVITTTTRVGAQPNTIPNTRYNNTASTKVPNVTKTTTSNYTRPGVQLTYSYNKPNNNINTNNRIVNTNSNQVLRNYQRPANQNNQLSRIQNSQSYSGNRNQPKRLEVSTSRYRPRATSPNPGSEKRKTINRGKPIENVQITHIIYSSQPLDFHIIENLNTDNLNTERITLSEEKRKNLQKIGKMESTCSCDKIEIKKPKRVNLTGNLTHYQHAQGIGMTDDKKENINPQFYFSEIKVLEPLALKKGESHIEVLEFRSDGKNYKSNPTIGKTSTRPVVKTTTSNVNRSSNNYVPNRTYNTNTPSKNNYYANNRGGTSGIKTTTFTSSSNRGNNNIGSSGKIVKETTTKVQMGSRSQYHNQSKPIVSISSERKVYNQNNFFKK